MNLKEMNGILESKIEEFCQTSEALKQEMKQKENEFKLNAEKLRKDYEIKDSINEKLSKENSTKIEELN